MDSTMDSERTGSGERVMREFRSACHAAYRSRNPIISIRSPLSPATRSWSNSGDRVSEHGSAREMQ